jgi:hypothetical protein
MPNQRRSLGHRINAAVLGRPYRFKGDQVSTYHHCPECLGRGKLEVNPVNREWFCHKCGVGGAVEGRVSVRQPAPCSKQESIEGMFSPVQSDGMHLGYLRSRGLKRKEITALCPHYGPELMRVYLPVFLPGSDQPAYMIGRTMIGEEPRYRNPPMNLFPRRRNELLWGLHRFQGPVERVVVCEGILDAVWGKDRVATLGKVVSDRQIEMLTRIALKEIVLMPDGDALAAAMETAGRIARRWFGRIRLVRLPYGCDPDGLGREGDKLIEKGERIA